MKDLRRVILGCLAGVLIFVGITFWLSAHYVVPILMYHNVEDSKEIKTGTVSPKTFAIQMEYLRAHGYHVIGLDKLVRGIHSGERFPYKTVAITVDDGYRNNYIQAFPVLKKYKYPVTFFISPYFVVKEKEQFFMSREQIKEMSDFGMSFGSHGMTQAYLPDLSEPEQDVEIFTSKKVLEETLGVSIDYFAYPVGGFTSTIKEKVQSAGYHGALTTNRGHDRFNRDLYELKRIRLNDNDRSEFILWAKLDGFYNLLRKGKNSN